MHNKNKWRAALLIATSVLTVGCEWQKILNLPKVATFFEESSIVENFTSMPSVFETLTVAAPANNAPLPRASQPATLPGFISVEGAFLPVDYFLDYTGTTGLLIIHNGEIVLEEYRQGHSENRVHVSWSVAKSMISALIGIAIAEGRITDVMAPVERYATQLAGTAYEGVPLKHVLQMSSGVAFSEDYDDDESDVVQLARIAALGGSFNAYAAKLTKAAEPGKINHYSSYDTQVLAMVLQGATNMTLSEYMSQKLWQPMGAEQDAYWVVDSEGMEMGFGGFNATLRDYGRFGLLYLNQGQANGQQVVPAAWIAESLLMDSSHLQPGNTERETFLGYGYQWWIPENAERDYMAIGVYNQFIYVSPQHNLVIVKNSANHHYVTDFDDFVTTYLHLAFFRQVAATLEASRG